MVATLLLSLLSVPSFPALPTCFLAFLTGLALKLTVVLVSHSIKMSSPQPKEVECKGFDAVMFHFGL